MITVEEFERCDVRLGRVTRVEHLPNPRHSTHRLTIDFGETIGSRQSCARLVRYSDQELLGKQVIALINIPPRQIGKALSEALTLGVPGDDGECILLTPDREAPAGGRLY